MLGYNLIVDPKPSKQLASLEKRCRLATGMVLAGMAFVASYGLILVGQPDIGRVSFFPLFLAVLFYIAGDLLALIWIRAVAGHIKEMLLKQLDEFQAEGGGSYELEPEVSPDETKSQVEVVRPDEEEE